MLLSHCMTSIPNIMLRNTQNTIHMDVEKRNSEKKEEKKVDKEDGEMLTQHLEMCNAIMLKYM